MFSSCGVATHVIQGCMLWNHLPAEWAYDIPERTPNPWNAYVPVQWRPIVDLLYGVTDIKVHCIERWLLDERTNLIARGTILSPPPRRRCPQLLNPPSPATAAPTEEEAKPAATPLAGEMIRALPPPHVGVRRQQGLPPCIGMGIDIITATPCGGNSIKGTHRTTVTAVAATWRQWRQWRRGLNTQSEEVVILRSFLSISTKETRVNACSIVLFSERQSVFFGYLGQQQWFPFLRRAFWADRPKKDYPKYVD